MLPAADLHAGSNEVRLAFLAGDASLNRNDDFLYTLFVPARAHLAFPCFDQPDLKARWTLALDVPAGWQALANGAETAREESARTSCKSRSPRRRRSRPTCSRSPPASSRSRPRERNGRDVPDVPPRDRRREGRAQPRRDLRSARRGARLARATTPASRIRSASSISCWCPSFQFGGMEHAGAIFYNASGPDARRVGDAEPAARARQRHRARDGAHVVRRSRDDAVVQRRVDEGGVRQLHGREDRQPVVPGDQSRAAVPAMRTIRRPTTSIARPARTRSASRSTT